MDSSDVPATVPSGATTLGGVQVLPIRLPTLPPTLEAALLGITHSLVAAPVLYAVATPAFEVMSRYWIYLIQRGAFLLSNPFVSMPRWGFWRYTGGLGYSTVRLLLLTVLAAAAVHVLTLPLQVGARRRARTDRRTVPVYAAAGGLGLALVRR